MPSIPASPFKTSWLEATESIPHYLKQRTLLERTHRKAGRPDLDDSRNQETRAIRKAKKLRDDNYLFSSSSSSLGRMPSAAAGYRCLLQTQSPEESIQLAKPRPS